MSEPTDRSVTSEEPDILLVMLRTGAALARSWRFLVFGGILFLAIAAGLILLIPLAYDAKATILFTATKSSNGNALSLLKEAGLGTIMGQEGADVDQAENLLESDKLAFWAFQKFDLDTLWRPKGLGDSLKPEEIGKRWFAQFHHELSEKDALLLTFRSSSPELSAKVVEGVCGWLDSMTLAIHQSQTRHNLEFIEEQLAIQTAAFDTAQARLLDFQRRNRILSLPEQVQATVEGSGKLESEALMADIHAKSAIASSGEGSSEARRWEEYRDQLRSEARRILSDPGSAGAFQGLDRGIGKFAEIGRLQRQVLERKTVYALLAQQREQLLLESRKSLPSLFVLDHPFVPKKRAAPPRRSFFYLAFVIWFLGAGSWVVVRDSIRRRFWKVDERKALLDILALVPTRFLRLRIVHNLHLDQEA